MQLRHDPTPHLTLRGWKARARSPFRSREKNVLDFPSYRSGHFTNYEDDLGLSGFNLKWHSSIMSVS
jgi:hypothetical protein